MRVIKFRAWHKQENEMFTVAHLCFGIDGLRKVDTGTIDSASWRIEDIELMQFTGMTDKHGREIYEGDIVAIGSARIEVQFGLFAASELAIADGHEWEDTGRAMAWSINEDDASTGEIIGNIYENPDLLKAR